MKGTSEKRVTLRVADTRLFPERMEVDVEVYNGADRSLLVVDEVRAIRWDEARRTVEILLCDRAAPDAPQGACRAPSMPKTREVPAGETVTISIRIPLGLWRITPRASSEPRIDYDDLTTAAAVTVHVAVANGPFYYRPSGPSGRSQLADWGEVVTANAAVRPTPEASR